MDWKDKKVLVTGGAGFIGSHLSKALIEKGANLLIIDDFSKGLRVHTPSNAKIIESDIRDTEVLNDIVKFDPNIVFHLAAVHFVPYCNNNPVEAIDINTEAFRKILSSLKENANPRNIIFTSSANVYKPDEKMHTEGKSKLDPVGIYGKSKLLSEVVLENFSTNSNIDATSLRLFNVYGTNETNPHLIPEVLDQIKEGNESLKLGNLKPKRDFVHVSDVVRALILAVENTKEGYSTYNVGTGREISARNVIKIIQNEIDREISLAHSKDKLRENDRPHLQANVDKIQSELNWEPKIEFDEGIKRLVRLEMDK